MRFFLAGLSKLTNLYVHAENPYFITEDSVLYTKDPMTGERSDTLIGYPKGKQTSNFTYTIPDGVTTVGTYAFYGNAKLQTLVISSNVQTIQEYAFQNCPSLTSLQFEERESVLSLGDRAFYGCSRLNGISETQEDGTTKNVFTIPATVKMDGIYVFGNCFRTSVTNLHVVFEDGNVSTSLDWTFYGCTGIIGVENIPAKLTSMNRTFSGCTKLQSVDFADDPDGMIESMAGTFYNCSSLVNVELPKVGILTTAMTISGDYNPTSTSYIGAFQRCTALQSVTVEACTEIGDSAFNGCTALQSVKISNGVTSIGRGAFYGCTALTEIALNGDVEKIPDYAFMNCTALEKVEVSDSVKTIGTSAFENCSALTEFTIPAEVVGIGERAFYGCAGLNNATIEKVETLGEYAFYGCAGLQTVNIPASLKIVPAYAFADCTGVKPVDLAEGVETIGDFAFMNMSQVTSFVLPASVQSIGAGAFSGWTALQSFAVNGNHFVLDNGIVYSADRTQIVVVLPSVAGDIVIPDQVTELAEGAFMNSKITSIVLSDNIKVIPARTFQGCTYLTSVKMPSALERIGNMAFEGCTALKSITIPKTVYSSFDKTYADPYEDGYTVGYYPANDCDGIGHYAFGNCTALQNVVFEEGGTKRLSFGDFAFYGCTSLQGTLNEITGEYEFIIPARVRGDAIPIYAYINPENPGAGNAHDRYAQGIGMYAFARCTALTNVVFEAVNGTEIPEPLLLEIGAFYECSALKSVTFNGALRSVSISLQGAKGDTVTYTQAAIAENAFYGCTALTTLNFAAEASFEYAATAFNGLNVALPTGAVMVDGSTGEKWGEDETYWYVDNADYFGVDGCLLCKDDCEFYDPHNGVFI